MSLYLYLRLHLYLLLQVEWGIGIVGDVAKTGESTIVNDCYKDSRFNVKIDELTGYTTKSMMCSPIKDKSGEVLGVSQVINKSGEGYFNEKDEVVFERYLQFCGIGLRNAQLFTMEQLAVQRVQVLLDLCGVIFQEQSTEEMIIHRILLNILTLILGDVACSSWRHMEEMSWDIRVLHASVDAHVLLLLLLLHQLLLHPGMLHDGGPGT